MLSELLIVTAVSLDVFFGAVSFGVSRVKIPLYLAILITAINTFAIMSSLLLSSAIAHFVSARAAFLLGFCTLCLIGTLNLFRCNKKKNEELPLNSAPRKCQIYEACLFGFAVAIDAAASGFAAGLIQANAMLILVFSVVIAFLSVVIGNYTGLKAGKFRSLSRFGGLILIVMAFAKLL